MDRVELSAVLVAGPRRAPAQRVLDPLGAQTVRDRMEAVVVDLITRPPLGRVGAVGAWRPVGRGGLRVTERNKGF